MRSRISIVALAPFLVLLAAGCGGSSSSSVTAPSSEQAAFAKEADAICAAAWKRIEPLDKKLEALDGAPIATGAITRGAGEPTFIEWIMTTAAKRVGTGPASAPVFTSTKSLAR